MSAPPLQVVPSATAVPEQVSPEQTSPEVHALPSSQAVLIRHSYVPPALVHL